MFKTVYGIQWGMSSVILVVLFRLGGILLCITPNCMTVFFLGGPCPEELCFIATFLSRNDSRSLDSRLDLKQYHLPGINHEAHTDK